MKKPWEIVDSDKVLRVLTRVAFACVLITFILTATGIYEVTPKVTGCLLTAILLLQIVPYTIKKK